MGVVSRPGYPFFGWDFATPSAMETKAKCDIADSLLFIILWDYTTAEVEFEIIRLFLKAATTT